jgi:putative N6-adenine-specific DNA methylase
VVKEKELFKIVVKTFGGLEEILAAELEKIGAKNINQLKRAVECYGDNTVLYKANLWCRTALKVLKPVEQFVADDPEKVYHKLRHIDWNEYLTPEKTFSIHSVVHSENFSHSKFVSYKVKDAIVDFFNKEHGKRPSVSLTNPDIMFNIHISGTDCTLSLDSSGESLHRRGWREEQTEAPLNEVLAAGLLLLAGWDGQSDLYDPMCGSGTLLVEAAMIATNTPPGIYRTEFAFEKWNDFDSDLWQELYNDDSHEKAFDFKIYGSDVSKIALNKAIANIKSSGLSKYIETENIQIQQFEPKGSSGFIITNPPYGERLKVDDLELLYGIIGERLKHNFIGYEAWILGYTDESFHSIGLRHRKKIAIKNGALDCQFRKYEIYEGSKKEKKQIQIRDKGSFQREGNKPSFSPRPKPTPREEGERKITLVKKNHSEPEEKARQRRNADASSVRNFQRRENGTGSTND